MAQRRAREAGYTESAQRFHTADVLKGLKDWKIYAFCAGQFGADAMYVELCHFITSAKPICRGIAA